MNCSPGVNPFPPLISSPWGSSISLSNHLLQHTSIHMFLFLSSKLSSKPWQNNVLTGMQTSLLSSAPCSPQPHLQGIPLQYIRLPLQLAFKLLLPQYLRRPKSNGYMKATPCGILNATKRHSVLLNKPFALTPTMLLAMLARPRRLMDSSVTKRHLGLLNKPFAL